MPPRVPPSCALLSGGWCLSKGMSCFAFFLASCRRLTHWCPSLPPRNQLGRASFKDENSQWMFFLHLFGWLSSGRKDSSLLLGFPPSLSPSKNLQALFPFPELTGHRKTSLETLCMHLSRGQLPETLPDRAPGQWKNYFILNRNKNQRRGSQTTLSSTSSLSLLPLPLSLPVFSASPPAVPLAGFTIQDPERFSCPVVLREPTAVEGAFNRWALKALPYAQRWPFPPHVGLDTRCLNLDLWQASSPANPGGAPSGTAAAGR